MQNRRVTIKDIANELGVSTATVSNVIHGKTKKISEKTIAKVQEKLESSGYIPNMAAVLLAQNSSKIVCVMLSNDIKYENHMLEDPFVAGMLNGLSKELTAKGYFMMLKEEKDVLNIVEYASMWNMAGLILIGYCKVDYEKLRSKIHIPFVVIDSYTDKVDNYSDVGIDNINGGYLAGKHLIENGHKKIMYIADNKLDCDYDRYIGLCNALTENSIEFSDEDFKLVANEKADRYICYGKLKKEIGKYTAAFCASDVYAIEFMHYLIENGVSIPSDLSIIGFDNIPLAKHVYPSLTTISQDLNKRAAFAVKLLLELINGENNGRNILLPVELIERGTVSKI